MELLKQRVEVSGRLTDWLLPAILIVFGVGTIGSIFNFIQTERRTSQSHGLMIDGERAAQHRDVSIFEQSQRTLTLVNETLGLAKEASARASKSLANRLGRTSRELEKQAAHLIEEVEAYKDDKNLVAKHDRTSRVHSLGSKIKALENNLVILEDETIELGPLACIITGIDSHLHEGYEEAIDYWERAATHKEASPQMRSLAYYWLGYVHNNLRDFPTAVHNLDNALQYAIGTRRYEIRRLQIESRFFNREDGDELIAQLERLIIEFNEEFSIVESKEAANRNVRIETTLGNVCFQIGNETRDAKYYVRSRQLFEEALKANESDKWVLFGLAETLHKLGELEKATDIYINRVLREAEKEFLTREEKRTKVLAKTTILICLIRGSSREQHIKDRYDEVISLVAELDGRLTVYSQMQRRNVSKDQFLEDLRMLMLDAPQAPESASPVGKGPEDSA
jgi:tetratricopeptide (TPR) repeat protein